MLSVSRAFLTVTVLLTVYGNLRAGVYFTTPREPFPIPTAQDKVKNRIGTLTMLDDRAQKPETPPSPERRALLDLVENQLEPKHKKNELTLPERVNLSAAYIRLGRHARARTVALEVLDEGPQQVKDDAPERFLLMANLAAAYNDGNAELLSRAIIAQDRAIKAAPAKPPVADWSQEQWDSFLIAERYDLRLLQLRRGEGPRVGNWKTFDALFDKVRFVGPTGEYEAGKLSAESLHELPRDAMPIVVQLLDWLPTDSRLYWLYGELLNAEGRVNESYKVLDELRFARGLGGIRELGQHRQIVKEAVVPEKPDVEVVAEKPPTEEPQKTDDRSSKGLPNWRALGTGFLAGLLVAAFGGLQLYIWLRRRSASAEPVRSVLRDDT